MAEEKTAIVTGSSTGIGFETSLMLARTGFYTYATMRNLDKSYEIMNLARKDNLSLQALQLDVTDDKSVKNAIDRIVNERKRIDVLVNNAGYGLSGALEDLSMDEIRAQFETNLFGAIRVMKAVLPIMREQRGGTIINISSIAGRFGSPLFPAYHGTKFALEGISESMRFETEPFGIKVVLIEPGAIATNVLKNAKVGQKTAEPSSPYASMTKTWQKSLEHFFDQAAPPEEVAKVILKAVTSDNPGLRYLVGDDAKQLMEARKQMSDPEFEGLVKQQFLAQ
jgi:NAD(P)-dependent dehydrogenase (short-subunit alcohol dehydrogenase family)